MKTSCGARTLAIPTPVWVVCTYNEQGEPNAMTASWACICCSDPASLAIALRSATSSHGNIKSRRAFTVCIPGEQHIVEADYFGMVSGKNTDKIKAAGLTAERSSAVDAPFIKEFPVAIECSLSHTFELGLHTLFVGRIADVKAENETLGPEGAPLTSKVKPFLYDPGSSSYFASGDFLGKAFDIGTRLRK